MDQTAVVYYYADPAYRGDMAAALAELTDRGYRVVEGDNADELLFLLQVGRPAAVIYTLAEAESITSAAFQMVSRRAFDLLVPIIAVGPAEPRDGVTLVYPEGRKSAKKHVPFHSMAALISEYDKRPPSTPSRPPEKIKDKTLGKGRTLLSWKPPSVVGSEPAPEPPKSVPPRRPSSDKRTLQMSAAAAEELMAAKAEQLASAAAKVARRKSDKRTLEMTAAAAEELVAAQTEQRASKSARVTRRKSDKRTLEMSAAAAAKKTTPEIPHRLSSPGTGSDQPPSDPMADTGASPRVLVESSREIEEPSIGALMREADNDATARTRAQHKKKSRTWRIVGLLLAVAAIAAVGVVIFLATRPAAPPPQPLRLGDAPQGQPKPPAPSPQPPTPTSVPPAPVPEPPTPEPPTPAPEPDDVSPKPAAEADEVAPTAEEVASASPVTVGELIPGHTTRFPAHFRPGTATFWYSEEGVEAEFLAKVQSLGPGRTIHIIGHPTADEARAKNWSIGTSRAWAVEKYLVRNGIDPESIETSRGVPVEPREDQDYRGWLRNRWVDIEVK
ncbi:MAG: OmpA family protein [Deltaproteobacteria bacterium]|nr:OmpA family protein [Deltaproteobacteria bacterium]